MADGRHQDANRTGAANARRSVAHAIALVASFLLACIVPLSGSAQVRVDADGIIAIDATSAAPSTTAGTRLPAAAPLGRYTQLFDETRGHPLDLDGARAQLASGGFRRSDAAVPNLGNRAPPLWMHLAIDNAGAAPLAYRLYVAEGWTDRVDAWLVPADGAPVHWQGGDARSPARYLRAGLGFAFDAQLPPGRSELFVRADSIDSAALALRMVPTAETGALEGAMQHWLGLVHGFLLALVVTYGLLWLALRETSLLGYVVYVGSYLYMHLAYSGIAALALWPQSPAIARFAILVGMTLFSSSGLWFARDFLRLSQWAPRTDRLVAWIVRIALLAMAACVLADAPSMAVALAFPYIMLFTVLMVVLGAMGVRHGREQARIFLVASLASMAGAFVTTLAVMGKIPFSALTFRAVEVGVMVEASIWALALGLRLRRDREDRVQALQLAEHDPLTGLFNRRGFLEHALPEHEAALRNARPLSLVLLDIDHFKDVNDRHGHDAGDRALAAVADRLRLLSRLDDIIARWGGEEFVLLLPDTSRDAAYAFAELLRADLAHTVVTLADGSTVSMTASLGVAGAHRVSKLDDLLRHADAALYAAKQAGRNRVIIAGESAVA